MAREQGGPFMVMRHTRNFANGRRYVSPMMRDGAGDMQIVGAMTIEGRDWQEFVRRMKLGGIKFEAQDT